uniref:Uncharacterized protein n=1 Tax=Tanacetum cinerariifolium TaxID=118510 RepID=A0A6L2JK08_TANCI|nr:hypothetical protein [Tanacetum cinerariifolium]
MEEGRLAPILVNLQHFRAARDLPMNLEEAKLQIQEAKRLADLKTEREKDEYNHYIKIKDDPLPITKFNYKVNKTSKVTTMRIIRNNQSINLKIYDKFILKMLGFSEWLELHDLESKKQNDTNDQLLKNLKAKFQWVAITAGKLSIPAPPQLTTFELPPVKKKKKRKGEMIHEVFIKENIMVDGM